MCQHFFIYDLLIAKRRKSWQNANQTINDGNNKQTIKREIPHTRTHTITGRQADRAQFTCNVSTAITMPHADTDTAHLFG